MTRVFRGGDKLEEERVISFELIHQSAGKSLDGSLLRREERPPSVERERILKVIL